MPSIYDLKPRFQTLLRPLCGVLANRGITANQITITATLISIVTGAWIALMPGALLPLLILPVVLFIRMALNAIDGMLAREFNQMSKLGAILNEMGDVISDAALYLPLALNPLIPGWLVIAIVMLGMMVEMIGVVAIQIGAQRRYDGPFGKSDRAFAFSVLALLIAFGIKGGVWIQVYLGVMLVLSVLTLFNRARMALAQAQETT